MPYRLEWNNKTALVIFDGIMSRQGLRDVGNAFYGDSRLDALECLIADFNNADLSQLTFDDINTIASIDSATVMYKPKLKMAFVTSDHSVREVLKKYIDTSETLSSTWNYSVFNKYEDARNWCELD